MQDLNKKILFALLAIALAIGPLACRDKAEPTVTDSAPAAKLASSTFPAEPIEFPVKALEGTDSVPLNVEVRTRGGEVVKLSELVSGPTLLVYIDSDTDNRQNRAATRMLRRLVREGRGVGFRTVVLFTWGTEVAEFDTWLRKRQVANTVKLAVDHTGGFGTSTRWSPRSAALIDEGGTVGHFFGASEEWDSRLGFDGGMTSDVLARAWQNPYSGPVLDDASKQAAVQLVRAALRTQWQGDKLPSQLEAAAGVGQLADKLEHPVYVSLFREGSTVRLRGEHGAGSIGTAIATATRNALASQLPASGARPRARCVSPLTLLASRPPCRPAT